MFMVGIVHRLKPLFLMFGGMKYLGLLRGIFLRRLVVSFGIGETIGRSWILIRLIVQEKELFQVWYLLRS